MCCIISGEPIDDPTGRYKTFQGQEQFQRSMMWAPCAGCGSFLWFCGQFITITGGCTQWCLRRKVLEYDMTRYTCFQGYFKVCCCVESGSCGESNCPDCCAFMEGCFCNCFAVSVNRMYVMEKYDLTSDPCDYRLIRINNCLQILACCCDILAIFIAEIRTLAQIIDRIADLFYHCISGCMTAQAAYEMDYRLAIGDPRNHANARQGGNVPPHPHHAGEVHGGEKMGGNNGNGNGHHKGHHQRNHEEGGPSYAAVAGTTPAQQTHVPVVDVVATAPPGREY